MTFSRSLFQLVLISICAQTSLATLCALPASCTKATYDYIVVGAGTAGNVVASRLSENPAVSVLVLEAGVSNEGVLASQVPLLGPSLVPNTIYDWNYTTTSQPGLKGRSIPYPRGRMLGGSSSVNYMVFMRGSEEDFNRYASVTGDSGWNWNSMQQYIKKNEKVVAPADGHDTTGQFIPSLHGTSGAVSISLPGFPTPLDSRVMATLNSSSEFKFNPDMGGGNVLGIGWTISSIGSGTRSSSATAYLTPALSRSNIDVVINAQVTKLTQSGTVGGLPSFRCLQYAAKDDGKPPKSICAKKGIILSAGSVGTPTILQLSGIGDRNDLQSVGIKTIVNNPSVGKNLSDHTLLTNVFSVNSNQSFDGIFRDPNTLNADIAQWQTSKNGPLAGGVANHLGWLRLPSTSSIFKTVKDPAAGPKSSHWEILFSNLWVVPGVPAPSTGNFMTVSTVLISPTSRGTIKLASSNPFVAPRIDLNFLSTAFDIFTMKEAVKAAKRFVSGSAWTGYVSGPYGALANTNNDADLENYVRSNAATIFHPVGTASMSPKGAQWGVVDPNLKVKGVDGLWVADGSVLPYAPNAHTQGPIYLVGERAADLIKAAS